jgi:hypothetical protein
MEKSTHGWPGKYTMCFAEHTERNPWEPLHVELGFAPDVSIQASGKPPAWRCEPPELAREETPDIKGRHAGMAQKQFLPSPLRRPQRNE